MKLSLLLGYSHWILASRNRRKEYQRRIQFSNCKLKFYCQQDTPSKIIEETFRKFLVTPNIAVILIAEKELRHIINEYDDVLPTILEIPSKEYPYEPAKVKQLKRTLSCKEQINFCTEPNLNKVFIKNLRVYQSKII